MIELTEMIELIEMHQYSPINVRKSKSQSDQSCTDFNLVIERAIVNVCFVVSIRH